MATQIEAKTPRKPSLFGAVLLSAKGDLNFFEPFFDPILQAIFLRFFRGVLMVTLLVAKKSRKRFTLDKGQFVYKLDGCTFSESF